jgi:hypothetical protein
MERDLRYKLLENGVVVAAGSGFTHNIGSGGISFFAGENLAEGSFVELSISWPVLLAETCPMRLNVFGRVLRSDGRNSACSIEKYEFRTQARVPAAATPIRSDSMLQRWAEAVRKETLKVRLASA